MASLTRRSRKQPVPPSGFANHLSRRDAAVLLGFASEFKVRQLEKGGHLHPIRGAMGQAWYPRAEVLALRPVVGPPNAPPAVGPHFPVPTGRLSDAALIAYLRGSRDGAGAGQSRRDADREDVAPSLAAGARPRPSVVDLVADTGVSISRAERVYRFWLAHDTHPAARAVRRPSPAGGAAHADARGEGKVVPATSPVPHAQGPSERRGSQRISRDALIRQLRDANPAVRRAAFEKLKK